MTDDSKLVRCAAHESARATLALLHHLPLKDVTIQPDGSGRTAYSRRFSGTGEIEAWITVTLAGPAFEHMIFGSAPIGGDIDAIREMTKRMEVRCLALDDFRTRARQEVRLHRRAIACVATALQLRRHMSDATVAPAAWVR
jgi:hypothetical protein